MSKKRGIVLPGDLEELRAAVARAISPLKTAAGDEVRDINFWLKAERTKAGRQLPPYHLVYFMLVDLLGFRNLGRWEKTDWILPVEFGGKTFTIEYRKMGLGIFIPNAKDDEPSAQRIADLIKRGVKVAEPFFEWLATNAVQESKLNVENQSGWLLSRFKYFCGRFDEACAEAERRRNENHVRTETLADGTTVTIGESPYYGLTQNARWIGLAAIDAFYSWTEHLFIHLAILRGRATTGEQVVTLAEADWSVKFKAALDITDAATKGHFDKLVLIRRQLRNFIAHGAFGKQGEAFHFHSTAGAVPVLLPRRPGKGRFALTGEPAFDEHSALKAIDEFIVLLWSGPRAPARIYLEGASVPTILPMATDGTYAGAMRSVEEMQDFVDALSRSFDAAADMDW